MRVLLLCLLASCGCDPAPLVPGPFPTGDAGVDAAPPELDAWVPGDRLDGWVPVADGSVLPPDATPIEPDVGPPIELDASVPTFEDRWGDEACLARLDLELGFDAPVPATAEGRVVGVEPGLVVAELDSIRVGLRWSGPSLVNAFMVDEPVTVSLMEGAIAEHTVRGPRFEATVAITEPELEGSGITPFAWRGLTFGATDERMLCGVDRFGSRPECPSGVGDESTHELTPTVNGRNALVAMSFTVGMASYTVAQARARIDACEPSATARVTLVRLEALTDPPPIPED